MADDIVQKIVVDGAEQAAGAFELIEHSATSALGSISGMAQTLVSSLGEAGVAIAAVAGAVTAFAGTLFSLTEHASESVAALRGLATVSGTSVENMSALVSAFSAAGVSADGLATNFKRLAIRVATDFPTIQKEVEEAADKIAQAQLNVSKAFAEGDKAAGAYIKTQQRSLDISTAIRAAREAEANDIRKFIQYFDDLAKGVKTSTDGMNMSLENLRKGLVGSLGGGIEALKEFSGSLSKVADKTVEDQLFKLADIFHNMPDGINKTALAVQLFGRSAGPGLIAFLNQGSAAIKEHEQHYKDLGLVITDVESGALKRFRIAQFELADVMDRLKEKFAAVIAPVFTERLEQVRQFLENHMSLWQRLGEAAKSALESIFAQLADTIDSLRIMIEVLGRAKLGWEAIGKAIRELFVGEGQGGLSLLGRELNKILDQLNFIAASVARLIGKFAGLNTQDLDKMTASALGLSKAMQEAGLALFKAYSDGKITLKEYLDGLAELRKKQTEVKDAAKNTGDAQKNANEQSGKSVDELNKKVAELQAKLKEKAVVQISIDQALAQLEQGAAGTMQRLRQIFTLDLTNVITINWSTLADGAQQAIDRIKEIFAGTDLSQSIVNWDTITQDAQNVADGIKQIFTFNLTDGITVDWNVIAVGAQDAANTLIQLFTTIGENIVTILGQAAQYAARAMTQAFDGIDFSSLFNMLGDLIRLFGQVTAAANASAAAAERLAQSGLSAGGLVGGVPMASGGLVSGPGTATSDSIWARLSAGEFVINAAAVARYGASMFASLNNFQAPQLLPRLAPIPAFASGGMVGGASRTLHLTIGGQTFYGLSAPEDVAQKLERFAVHSQIASTGRKPSWRR